MASDKGKYSDRIRELRRILSDGLLEKEMAVSLGLLCLIAGKSIFFYGPPGTAKSLVARRISCAFESNKFFDYLMNRFSTPEEIFGPLSLENLRKDKLVRKTEGFLPAADFAFLDEIWKSSPAILNSLLTIINEKKFRNILASDTELNPQNLSQEKLDKVPLKGLIAASNELPSKGQSLEALYDRFIMRLVVPRLESKKNFDKLLRVKNVKDFVDVDSSLKFSNKELDSIKNAANECDISDEAINVIKLLKERIESYNKEAVKNGGEIIDISERRWVSIMELLRFSAVLSDRSAVEISDLILLKHCLWDNEGQSAEINRLLIESLEDFSPSMACDTQELEALKQEVDGYIKHSETIYKGEVVMNGETFLPLKLQIVNNFRYKGAKFDIAIKKKLLNDNKQHEAYIYNDKTKNFDKTDGILYESSNDECTFYVKEWLRYYQRLDINEYDKSGKPKLLKEDRYKLPVKVKKDTAKSLTERLKKVFLIECDEMRQKAEAQLESVNKIKDSFINEYQNSFVDSDEYDIFFDTLKETQSNISQMLIDIKKLESEINSASVVI